MKEVPGLSVREEFVLPDPVGRVEGYYILHSELATLPQNIGKGGKGDELRRRLLPGILQESRTSREAGARQER